MFVEFGLNIIVAFAWEGPLKLDASQACNNDAAAAGQSGLAKKDTDAHVGNRKKRNWSARISRDGFPSIVCLCVCLSVQENLVARTTRNLLPSTHLIVSSAEGAKYKRAKEWTVPAISKLYVCLSTY